MRLIVVIGLLVVATGAVAFTALNADTITINFYVARFSAPLGIVLIAVLAAGWLLGGITVWLGKWRRQRMRRPRKATAPSSDAVAADNELRNAAQP